MKTGTKQSRERNGKLRVGSRRFAWPPPWIKVRQPPPDEPEPDPEPEPVEPAETIPDRSVWRSVLATWPIADRERWGRLANANEDQGMTWNQAEWRAFQEIA